MACLAPDFHVLAPEARGTRHTPPWPPGRPAALADEVEWIQPALAQACEPLALVGHSYGAAVALIAALQRRQRLCALALYEPTLFSLVDAAQPPPNDAEGIRVVRTLMAAALAAGRHAEAAEHFIDYWMGKGHWRAMPAFRRAATEATIVHAPRWAEALFDDPTPLSAFAELSTPVLLMVGRDSPASSLAVARLLAGTLPNVEVKAFAGLGHMGPITHPATVNAVIEEFLHRHSASITD